MDTTRWPGLKSWPGPKQSSAFMCIQHFLEAEINQGSQQNIIHFIRKWGFKWFYCGGTTGTQFHCCVQHYFCPLVANICLHYWNISKLFHILSDLCVLDILTRFLGRSWNFPHPRDPLPDLTHPQNPNKFSISFSIIPLRAVSGCESPQSEDIEACWIRDV